MHVFVLREVSKSFKLGSDQKCDFNFNMFELKVFKDCRILLEQIHNLSLIIVKYSCFEIFIYTRQFQKKI